MTTEEMNLLVQMSEVAKRVGFLEGENKSLREENIRLAGILSSYLTTTKGGAGE